MKILWLNLENEMQGHWLCLWRVRMWLGNSNVQYYHFLLCNNGLRFCNEFFILFIDVVLLFIPSTIYIRCDISLIKICLQSLSWKVASFWGWKTATHITHFISGLFRLRKKGSPFLTFDIQCICNIHLGLGIFNP